MVRGGQQRGLTEQTVGWRTRTGPDIVIAVDAVEQRLSFLDGKQGALCRAQAARLVHGHRRHVPLAAATCLPPACHSPPRGWVFDERLIDEGLPRQPLGVLAILPHLDALHLNVLRAISGEIAHATQPLLSVETRAWCMCMVAWCMCMSSA